MTPPEPRVPVEPLVQKYGTVSALARAVGCDRARFSKWRREGGMPLVWADRLAVSLGMHPIEVWEDWYEVDAAA